MIESESATETPQDGWGVNERGYIQGGYDTPIFLQVKRRFNSDKTDRKYKEKKLITESDPSFIAAQQQEAENERTVKWREAITAATEAHNARAAVIHSSFNNAVNAIREQNA